MPTGVAGRWLVTLLGAIALADTLGAPFEASVEALARFGGVARRLP